MITMNDIIRDDNPNLRKIASEVSLPIDDTLKELADKMIQFLKNSQNEDVAEEYNLRAGVGIAAPQLDVSKRMFAVHIPASDEDDFSLVLINPRILSHSAKKTVLEDGEGCLSVDDVYEGYVPRYKRITVEYYDLDGNKLKERFNKFPAIVIQHELDHLNGILFYDHINDETPFSLDNDTDIFENN